MYRSRPDQNQQGGIQAGDFGVTVGIQRTGGEIIQAFHLIFGPEKGLPSGQQYWSPITLKPSSRFIEAGN
ncbi:hypothetical protein [Marinobacter salarius]|uniref:hypothetical protein n=1 Tax=Marinobacter salarius TaxID=1420917 RepID=UPI0018F211C0|nr:hypothetical protein [Marinobacter salarius]MBJ7275659.1 hypothetical protein [Marinobacter salarius]